MADEPVIEKNPADDAVDPTMPPPAPQEEKLEILPCPCGSAVTNLRLEVPGKGAKLGQVRGDCCGAWAVEFIVNTDDPKRALRKAITAWNAAPRAA